MATGIFKNWGFWLAVAAGAVAWVAMGGTSSAQTSGTPTNSSPPAAGTDQNRDAGERGNRVDLGDSNRRGRGGRFGGPGGRERGGRGAEGGSSDNASSSGSTGAAKPAAPPVTPPVPEVSEAERARTWARELIQKHDKNGDMMLQESEWEGLGQSTRADANGDKVITLDELVAFASRKSTAPAAASSAAAPSTNPPPNADAKTAGGGSATEGSGKVVKTASHGASDSKSKEKQKTYRFKTAKERLPAGLPGWFTAKDANGDGQVSMSEYSKSWTESQAAEFKRYDKDNDGIITAEEAAKK